MTRKKPKGANTALPKLNELKLDGLLVPPSAQAKITQEMVSGVCHILWHNHQVWPTTQSVLDLCRHLYSVGGSFSSIAPKLKEWDNQFWAGRKEELDDPDELFDAALEVMELLPNGEVPEPLRIIWEKTFYQLWKVTLREASTTPLTGQAAKMEQELTTLRQQAADYPRLAMKVEILEETNQRVIKELNMTAQLVDQQKLADSKSLQQRNEHLNQQLLAEKERSDRLQDEVTNLLGKLDELSGVERDMTELRAGLELQQKQSDELRSLNKQLSAQVGEEKVLREQIKLLQSELTEANQTIANLQSRKSGKQITVDN